MVTTLINIYKFREWTLVAWHDSVIADGNKGDIEWDVKTKKVISELHYSWVLGGIHHTDILSLTD